LTRDAYNVLVRPGINDAGRRRAWNPAHIDTSEEQGIQLPVNRRSGFVIHNDPDVVRDYFHGVVKGGEGRMIITTEYKVVIACQGDENL
jgi:hypothetical protein